jgi:hypothetical protein
MEASTAMKKTTAGRALILWLLAGAVLLCCDHGGTGAQAITTLNVSWVQSAPRAFLRLNGDGSQVLIYRQNVIDKPYLRRTEELVLVPTGGGQEQVFYKHDVIVPEIYYNFALSGDAKTVVFAPAFENDKVYALTRPAAVPKVVAAVAPDEAPAQLSLTTDGKWVAFTASRMIWSGRQGLAHANLYVAAIDGSVLHKVTPSPVPGRSIPYALSADGSTIAWLDDAKKGPFLADRDGKNALRLPFPVEVDPSKGRIVRVFLDKTGEKVFYSMLESNETSFDGKLFEVGRNGVGLKRVHMAARGFFEVSRDGQTVRYFENAGSAPPRVGTSWLVGGQAPTRMFDYGTFNWGVGTYDWSEDGKVFVWYDERAHYGKPVMVWRAP